MSTHQIILGIDPGLADLGWSILKKENTTITMVDYGCIKTRSNDNLEDRLLSIHKELNKIISTYKPQEVAIEKLFFGKNAKTAMVVGHARGVVLLTIAQHNLTYTEMSPAEIKLAITGYGVADKKQIQNMLKQLLKLDHIPKQDDAADALAVAYTHAITQNILSKANAKIKPSRKQK